MTRPWILAVIGLLPACAGTGEVRSRLRSHSGPLMYLHDVPVPAGADGATARRRTVAVAPVAAADALPPSTSVARTSTIVVPLLLVNFWRHEFRATLGAREIGGDLGEFIRESLERELGRRSIPVFREGADVHVQVRLTSVQVTATVAREGGLVLLPWIMEGGSGLETGTASAAVRAEVVVREAGEVLFRKEIEGSARVAPLGGRKARFEDQTIAMIEALSLAVKELNSGIARQLDGGPAGGDEPPGDDRHARRPARIPPAPSGRARRPPAATLRRGRRSRTRGGAGR